MKKIIFIFFSIIPMWCFSQHDEPLFTLMDPGETGVDFQNTITDEKTHNILLYSNYYGGAGVGIGDFNRDGLQDLFFAGNLVGDRLYLNKGELTFEDVTDKAGITDNGGWSSGVLVGDVNNDGWPDIYVTRELYDESPDLRRNMLYINNGDGTFSERAAEYGIDNPERTRHATFIDYDRDGWLDLFLLNQPPNPGNYSAFFGAELMREEWAPRLYRNNGDGSFTDVSAAAGVMKPGYPNSVIAADLNKDGWPDLYVANDYEAPDFMYINNGDGTFTDVIHNAVRHISYYAMGVDAADINNDGWLDLMTLDMVAEDNFRLKSNMGGMYPEAFWKIVDEGGHHQYMFNALHLNQGDGQFSDIAQLAGVPSTDWSWSNVIADFDNDGWKDIFVTNGLLRDIRNSDAAKVFPQYVQQAIQEFIANNPNAGDVDIFDILDLDEALALLPSVPLKNYIFKNNGDLTFTKKIADWGLDTETFSNGCAYADLDNDGDLDLIVSNINAPAHIYKNNSERNGANWLRIKLTDRQKNESLAGTKIEIWSVGNYQFFEAANTRGMYSTSESFVHFGLGQIDEVDKLTITWPDGEKSHYEDIGANRLLTIDRYEKLFPQTINKPKERLFKRSAPPAGFDFTHRENNFDDYEKQVLLPHKMSQFGPALAVDDVNGDGLDDVFAGGAVGQPGKLFVQQKDGTFLAINTPDLETDKLQEDIDAVFFDADNDGDNDLYVVSGGNEFPQQNKFYQDRLYLNDGKGNFKRANDRLPPFRDSGACVRPCDYDGDGDSDLFVGGRHTPWSYPTPANSRLLRNDGGTFTDITKEVAPEFVQLGMVIDAVWSDYDGDGDKDLLAVGEWMPLTIFINDRGLLKPQTEKTWPVGWFYSIEAADIDGDGDDDYLAGNLGLNYKYKATEEEPFEVHYYDFDDSGTKDIVLSYYNFGEQYPLRGRSCSSQQVPEIKKKFPSYNIFASANLEQVYGEDKLEQALHYAATSFASYYIENREGKLAFHPLPNAAQVSSINDFLVEDFNLDGHPDVLMAGNLFPAEIETPRNDAGLGLLLTGDGKGNWTPVHPTESGIYLPYDVKKIRRLSSAGTEWYLFGINDGELRVLRRDERHK